MIHLQLRTNLVHQTQLVTIKLQKLMKQVTLVSPRYRLLLPEGETLTSMPIRCKYKHHGTASSNKAMFCVLGFTLVHKCESILEQQQSKETEANSCRSNYFIHYTIFTISTVLQDHNHNSSLTINEIKLIHK